nr:class I adenylate-forming enzyme family protein [Frigidibacter sp. ROC022]
MRAVGSAPDAPAVISAQGTVSHGQLAEASLAMALGLQDRGMKQGSTLAMRTGDPAVALASLLATALLGARWIYAHANLVGSDRLDIDMILDDGSQPGESPAGAVQLDQSWFAPRAPEGGGPRPLPFTGFRSPEDIWMISQTSGTTGTPKLVGLPYRVMMARLEANAARLDWRGLRLASLFPPTSPLWLTYALTALLHGGSVLAGTPPENWPEAKAGFVVSSPAQAQMALGELVLPRKLPLIQVSGGPVSDDHVLHLLQSFEEVWVGYGSTEAFNAMANVKTLDPDGQLRTRTVLAPDVRVEVVDDADQPLPAGQEGIVRVTNPYVAPGYINAPSATAGSFRDGWFYPGDIGRWEPDGSFSVLGRNNEQFNLGGQKLNAPLMDFALMSVPGVRDAICFMLPGVEGTAGLRAFLSVSPEADQTEVLAEARVALMKLGGLAAVPERILFLDSLPRNANGKADRRACVRLLEEGRARNRAVTPPKGP